MRRIGLGLATVIAAAFGMTTTALAGTTLSSPVTTISTDFGTFHTPGSYSGADPNPGASGAETGSVSGFPDAASSASVAIGKGQGVVNSVLSYDFSVDGAPNTSASIQVQYVLKTNGGLDNIANAWASIGVDFNFIDACSGLDPSAFCTANDARSGRIGAMEDIQGTAIFTVPSNTSIPVSLYSWVSLNVGGGAAPGQPDNFSGYASVDPKITVLTPGFTLNLPPGIGNSIGPSNSVPEPATWAMLLLGLGGIGAAARMARRREGTGLAAA